MSELTLQQVCVDRAGGRVVTDVSLTVRRGEVTTLIGPNGAGKTSLLEAISGLVDVAGGSITCDGHEITRHGKVGRRGLGIVHVEVGGLAHGAGLLTRRDGAPEAPRPAPVPAPGGAERLDRDGLTGSQVELVGPEALRSQKQ